jgi:hypothetical protein
MWSKEKSKRSLLKKYSSCERTRPRDKANKSFFGATRSWQLVTQHGQRETLPANGNSMAGRSFRVARHLKCVALNYVIRGGAGVACDLTTEWWFSPYGRRIFKSSVTNAATCSSGPIAVGNDLGPILRGGKERLKHCQLALARGEAEGLLIYGARRGQDVPLDEVSRVTGADPQTVLRFCVEQRDDEYWAVWGGALARCRCCTIGTPTAGARVCPECRHVCRETDGTVSTLIGAPSMS